MIELLKRFAIDWLIGSGIAINFYMGRQLLYYGLYQFSQWRWNRQFPRPRS